MLALRRIFTALGRAATPTPESAASAGHGVRVTADELIALRLKARDLGFGNRQAAQSALAGGHASRFRGRGMDYLESRAYQAGDDIRNMDWRVTARAAGRPHVKLYQEERERPVVVMVDLGPGMFFGTRGAFKSVVAARAAALIGWAAVHHHDRIGALLFNGGHQELRPLGGQRGVMRLVRELVRATEPQPGTAETHAGALTEALLRLRRVARPGSLVFILSDFYGIDEETHVHLQRLRQHNDVVACQIVDALELEPPPPDRYPISDGIRSEILDARSQAGQAAYRRYFAMHHARVRELMRRSAVPLLRIATSDDVAVRLRTGLAGRSGEGGGPAEAAA